MIFKELKELDEEEKARIINRNIASLSISFVFEIIEEVKKRGDDALGEYTRKFDNADLSEFRVSEEEFREAFKKADRKVVDAISEAHKNIIRFHEKQKEQIKDWFFASDGAKTGQVFKPIESVGCYIPGGKAAYPSSALMLIAPAKIAGVEKIVCTTPPREDGSVNEHVLIACRLAGATEVYKVGGVQAIAALAYGTESIPKVEKIIGPGNIFVTAAKKAVFGDVAIDMLAGPSEILIIADATANPEFIAGDLLAQLEHDENANAVLLTSSKELVHKVHEIVKSMEHEDRLKNLSILTSESLEECIDFCNEYAPEHLEIMAKNSYEIMEKIKSAGSIFLGSYTPVAAGDYASGTNHVLPTSRTARFFSGLNIREFFKVISFQEINKEGLKKLSSTIVALAEAEGLKKHAESIRIRLEEEKRGEIK